MSPPCSRETIPNFISNTGSRTGWGFTYFDQPDKNGYEVRKSPLLPPTSLDEWFLILLYSGTPGSILLLERESAALTIIEFSARLVALVILSVAVMDNLFAVTFLFKLVYT